ncbi:hypothetical protein GUJ93_ZPchr0009g2157 [Zizania palustris]|uniref:Alpha/beta hydrolase fold-3 domain-containing protein n=1 Tax=Zizania palustris TaxID=103762 RepID=A0A8J5RMJ3_ZIZPA|nr:hypothetical protein GUJ93_ZPchr0009g2157 [Zizania palustris]
MVVKIKRQIGSGLSLLAKLGLLLITLLLVIAAILLLVFLLPRHHRAPLPPGSPPPGNGSNPDDSVVAFDFSPFLIQYKSGRIYRMDGTDRVRAGVDEATGVTSKDVVIDRGTGLGARMYLPPAAGGEKKDLGAALPVLVFYHGGAFVIESAFTPKYHDYLNKVTAKARVLAVSVDYRLAPEHPLPTAYDDSWQALNWVARNARSGPEPWLQDRGNITRLFLAGDSAGGNIAHNMAMRAGREGGLEGGGRRRRYEQTWSFICNGKYGIDDPLVDPLSMPASEWRKMACSRVAVTVSDLDDFMERGKAYAVALRDSGWSGQVEQYDRRREPRLLPRQALEPQVRQGASFRRRLPQPGVADSSLHKFNYSCSFRLVIPGRIAKLP